MFYFSFTLVSEAEGMAEGGQDELAMVGSLWFNSASVVMLEMFGVFMNSLF